MTPPAGFVAAVVAGWLVRDPRRAVATVVVPFLAVLAAQIVGASPPGVAVSPPEHGHQLSRGCLGYWLVQVIILVPLASASRPSSGLCGPGRRGRVDGVAGAGRRAVIVCACLTLAAGVFDAVYAAQVSPVRDSLRRTARRLRAGRGIGAPARARSVTLQRGAAVGTPGRPAADRGRGRAGERALGGGPADNARLNRGGVGPPCR